MKENNDSKMFKLYNNVEVWQDKSSKRIIVGEKKKNWIVNVCNIVI